MKTNKTIGHFIHGQGDKKAIVLHSWMGDAERWHPCLTSMNPDVFTYAFMNVRGYGSSKDFEGRYNIEEIRKDVLQFAGELGYSKFSLIGHSMCGMVAQYMALHDHDRQIEKVVLVTPVASNGFPADETTVSFFESIVQNVEMAKMGFGAFTSNRLSDYFYTQRAMRHVEVTNKEAQLGYMNMWLNEDFKEKMKDVPHHFLVICGQHDHPMFRIEAQQNNFEGFKHVEFVSCENSGHFPMNETPVFLSTKIESFLSY